MSRVVDSWEYDSGSTDFELGEWIYFDHEGSRLYGEVVRVYNTRTVYHAEVGGSRYEVVVGTDNPSRAE